MALLGVAGSGPRRSMVVGSTSLALHGAVIALVVALVGERIERSPRDVAETPIEVVMAVRATPPLVAPRAQPVPPAAVPNASAVMRTRRAMVHRPESSAPSAKQSLAELTIGYDDPTNFVDRAATSGEGIGARRSGIRTSMDRPVADGVAAMAIPHARVGSRAR